MTHAMRRRLDKIRRGGSNYLGAIRIVTRCDETKESIARKVAEAKDAAGIPRDVPDDKLLVIIRELVSPVGEAA